MIEDARNLPIDETAAADLGRSGLRYGLVDTADEGAFSAWIAADSRGFAEPRESAAEIEAQLSNMAYRRTTGVWDDGIPDAATPVATVSSWIAELTAPGPVVAPAWAVSSVTVAATHRRRGIARALMEGELRNAQAAGVPVAMLTASEATIYSRYGYAPASSIATVEIDRRRATWAAPTPGGRTHYVPAAELLPAALDIAERAVRRQPGEVARWPGLLERVLGLRDPESESSRATRTVRYDDADGEPQGFVAYKITPAEREFGRIEVRHLEAATDEAYRALWKFLVEHDLVDGIRAQLRQIDEPLPWLLSDHRAVRWSGVGDHLWLRVLDPVGALEGRRYTAEGRLELDVIDPLGFAAGRYLMEVQNGRAAVTKLDESDLPSGADRIRLDVTRLGSMLLGGFRPSVLAVAGGIESDAGTLSIADRLFAADRSPHLSIWF